VIPNLFGQLCSFQGPARRAPRGRRGVVSISFAQTGAAGLSKLNSVCAFLAERSRPDPVDVLGPPAH
jgi:hypothetical protein